MASTLEFVTYACEQMSGVGEITYKKMFGEYGVYCNGKIIGLICDNQLFIKPTTKGREILGEPLEEPPYPGAKAYYMVEDLEDIPLLTAFVEATYQELPMPKPKKKKVKEAIVEGK